MILIYVVEEKTPYCAKMERELRGTVINFKKTKNYLIDNGYIKTKQSLLDIRKKEYYPTTKGVLEYIEILVPPIDI